MKKLFSIAAIVMIGALAFTSCKKSDNSSSNGSLKATAGSTSVNSNYCIATYSDSILSVFGANVSSSNPFPYVSLSLLSWNGTAGTYAIDGFAVGADYIPGLTTTVPAVYGTITISTVASTQISGTFSFTCSDSTKVTNGSFTAKGTAL